MKKLATLFKIDKKLCQADAKSSFLRASNSDFQHHSPIREAPAQVIYDTVDSNAQPPDDKKIVSQIIHIKIVAGRDPGDLGAGS